jgi:radical SAM protein with 4Fe4S-binding SPASM domain
MKFKKIYIEITNKCNLNCSFCSKDNREQYEMSKEEVDIVISEIKNYTDYAYLHVKGEPLLHSNLEYILTELEKNNIKVNITTNGTLLKEKKDLIIRFKNIIRQINISIQSVSTIEKIKEIIEVVNYINNNSNIYVVYRFWALKNNQLSSENKVILQEIIKEYSLDIEKIYLKNNLKIKNNLYLNKHRLFEWPNLKTNKKYNGFCLGLKSHIGILSNGTVVPCCLDGEGIINLGNIYKETLKDILNKEKTKKIISGFQNNKRVEELCKRCSFNKNSV